MFNKEQKERFLQSLEGKVVPSYIINVRSTFNKTEPFEEEYGKDVCNFSREEISSMYSTFDYSTHTTFATFNARLAQYTSWCMNNALVSDGCNHFGEFSRPDFETYVTSKRVQKNKYLSRETTYSLIGMFINARDKFLVSSLFEFGKSSGYTEIMNLKVEDIDEETKRVQLCTGRCPRVTDEWIEIAKTASAETEYTQLVSEIVRRYEEGDTIFRRVATGKYADNAVLDSNAANKLVTRSLQNIVQFYGLNGDINASSIAVSGQIDMIHRLAREKGITSEAVVRRYFNLLKEQYNMAPAQPGLWLDRFGAYL